MNTVLAIPSHTYNIVLTEQELEELIARGHVATRVAMTPLHMLDATRPFKVTSGQYLVCGNNTERYHVQFLHICLEKEKKND